MSRLQNTWKSYEKTMYLAIILIALGITFSTTMKESVGAIGTVFIALGGFFFIVGMSQKRKHDRENQK